MMHRQPVFQYLEMPQQLQQLVKKYYANPAVGVVESGPFTRFPNQGVLEQAPADKVCAEICDWLYQEGAAPSDGYVLIHWRRA